MSIAKERVARITSKGQVTIPADLRRELGVGEGDSVVFRSADGIITVASARKPTLSELIAGFDPKRHRHGQDERSWDDSPRGLETI